VKLQALALHKHTSGSHSKPLDYVIKAGLDEIIPVHTPAHQPGDFKKVLITLD
jgi:hypothetical protein